MTTEIRKVFIVDDDESVCRSINYLLTTYGYVVKTFLSGNDFFNAVAESERCCLILDIHLPGLNGWEIQKRLALNGSPQKIIIMTADKNGGLREQALEAGAVGFLQKPFDDQQLINLVSQSFSSDVK